MAYSRFGKINLRNARHAGDSRPLDPQSPHTAARDYSRAYLHHLVKAGEILGMMLITAINLSYYAELMAGARKAIADKRLSDFCGEVKAGWARGDAAAG